jgi:hypothetical protein
MDLFLRSYIVSKAEKKAHYFNSRPSTRSPAVTARFEMLQIFNGTGTAPVERVPWNRGDGNGQQPYFGVTLRSRTKLEIPPGEREH